MKIINPSFEIIEQDCSKLNKFSAFKSQKIAHLRTGIYKHIEKCGRTCYKSLDKITDDSCYEFVKRMMQSNHTAMLEHGTIYLTINLTDFSENYDIINKINKLINNKYTKANLVDNVYYITTNLRVIYDIFKTNNYWESYMTIPMNNHNKRYTVKFICNRQVSHEFVRHRVFSFAQESTRYCNYNKEKFGSELTFIKPIWTPYIDLNTDMSDPEYAMLKSFENCEKTYMKLINAGWKPQQAATILPNAIKTELIMTGFDYDWLHFFNLRAIGTTGDPHPQAKELAKPLMEEFIRRGYIKN